MNYKFHSIQDVFKFGKHKGETLGDVLEEDHTYIYWCINEIENFFLSTSVIEEIRNFFPDVILPYKLINHVSISINERRLEGGIQDADGDDDADDDPYQESDVSTYKQYSGSWAQDVEGYSDEDIDVIFDGDPNAYWNID